MQTRTVYPVDTVTGGCFITRRYEIEEGERIIDLDTDLDAMPAWGRLCISELAVKLLNDQLGWEVDPNLRARVADHKETIRQLRAENKELRGALEAIGVALRRSNIAIPEPEPVG